MYRICLIKKPLVIMEVIINKKLHPYENKFVDINYQLEPEYIYNYTKSFDDMEICVNKIDNSKPVYPLCGGVRELSISISKDAEQSLTLHKFPNYIFTKNYGWYLYELIYNDIPFYPNVISDLSQKYPCVSLFFATLLTNYHNKITELKRLSPMFTDIKNSLNIIERY